MQTVKISTVVKAPAARVWQSWTTPKHITKWNHANDDWHSPAAENDLTVGGEFIYRMESKDGKTGFDFSGIYEEIEAEKLLKYKLENDRKVTVKFTEEDGKTTVTQIFEPEDENSVETQKAGWQSILDNFKKYTENLSA